MKKTLFTLALITALPFAFAQNEDDFSVEEIAGTMYEESEPPVEVIENPDAIKKILNIRYMCYGTKRIDVKVGFNKTGHPVNIRFKLDKKYIALDVDKEASTSARLVFANEDGYKLTSPFFVWKNYYEKARGLDIFAPNQNRLFEDCVIW